MFPYPKVNTKKTKHPIKTPSPAVDNLSHIRHPDLDRESAIAHQQAQAGDLILNQLQAWYRKMEKTGTVRVQVLQTVYLEIQADSRELFDLLTKKDIREFNGQRL